MFYSSDLMVIYVINYVLFFKLDGSLSYKLYFIFLGLMVLYVINYVLFFRLNGSLCYKLCFILQT